MNNTIRRDGWRYEFAFLLTPFSNHYVTATDCAQRTVACLVDALSTVNGRVRVWWLHGMWRGGGVEGVDILITNGYVYSSELAI